MAPVKRCQKKSSLNCFVSEIKQEVKRGEKELKRANFYFALLKLKLKSLFDFEESLELSLV